MTDDFNAIFSHTSKPEPDQREPIPTPVEETVEAPKESGTVEEQSPPKPETVEAPREKHHIPVEALIEERTKAREAKLELEKVRAEYEARLKEAEASQQRNDRPDPLDDPDGFTAFMKAEVVKAIAADRAEREQEQLNRSFTVSHTKAVEAHGEETVKTALEWATQRSLTDDAWSRQALSDSDPVSWILEQQNRHAQFEEFARDPEGFKARLLAESGNADFSANPTPMAAKVAAPKSLASSPSLGKNVINNKNGDDAFNAIFKK